jgi:large subunit ribosomal protein L20
MTRVKSLAAKKHRKIREAAKGFRQARRSRAKAGLEAVMHAGKYAYIGRRLKKRDLRSLWITRINTAAREKGISYSQLISKLKDNKIEIDRKILSELAVKNPDVFDKIIEELK